MKLNILFKRESFEFIFIKTVESYLKSQLNWNGNINIVSKSKTQDTFLLNTHLNIIFPANISESSLKLLINEHYYDKCFFKNDLEKDLYKIINFKMVSQFSFFEKTIFYQ